MNVLLLDWYDSKKVKIIKCFINEKEGDYNLEKYNIDGVLETVSSIRDFKLNGYTDHFYPSGKLSSTAEYTNGKKQGIHRLLLEDGRTQQLTYNYNGNFIYRKTYSYEEKTPTITEAFKPIITVLNDSLEYQTKYFEFEVSFLLPDSLLRNRELTFAYGLKSMELKDSIIIETSNEVLLNNKEKLKRRITLEKFENQIFYGHLIDKKENHIHNPFEKLIKVTARPISKKQG